MKRQGFSKTMAATQVIICLAILLTVVMGCSNDSDLHVLREEFLISVTLLPLDTSLNDYEVTITKNYYDGKWYKSVIDWTEAQNVDSFLGSAYYKTNEDELQFIHLFSKELDRDNFFSSKNYASLEGDLADVFEILDSSISYKVSGHGGHPTGGISLVLPY